MGFHMRRGEKASFHFINGQVYVVEAVLVHIEYSRNGDDDDYDNDDDHD